MDRRMGEIGDKERMAWLRLARSRGLGVITIRDLVAHFGSAAAALEALPDLAARGGRSRPLRLASEGEAEHELATLDKLGARLIACEAGLRMAALDRALLLPGVEVAGVATFLEAVGDGQMISL